MTFLDVILLELISSQTSTSFIRARMLYFSNLLLQLRNLSSILINHTLGFVYFWAFFRLLFFLLIAGIRALFVFIILRCWLLYTNSWSTLVRHWLLYQLLLMILLVILLVTTGWTAHYWLFSLILIEFLFTSLMLDLIFIFNMVNDFNIWIVRGDVIIFARLLFNRRRFNALNGFRGTFIGMRAIPFLCVFVFLNTLRLLLIENLLLTSVFLGFKHH